MAARATTVKKNVVRLSREERGQLDELIRKGKRTAQLLTKARILLKADVLASNEGWSDSPDRRGAGYQHRHYDDPQSGARARVAGLGFRVGRLSDAERKRAAHPPER